MADPEVLTVPQLAQAIGKAIQLEFELVPFQGGGTAPDYAGASPRSVERPFVLHTVKARGFGWDGGLCYQDAVRPGCRWLVDVARNSDRRDHFAGFLEYDRDVFDYAAEDRLIPDLLTGEEK